MTVTAEDLEQYADQKVIVVYTPTGEKEAKEVEGTAQAANAMGILLKPKGRQNVELIEIEQIEDVRFAPEKPKDLKAQRMDETKYGAARKHLLDRHAGRLDKVNKLSEEDALKAHADTDHSNLGHFHGPKPEKSEGETASE